MIRVDQLSVAGVILLSSTALSDAANLVEPPTFTSQNGVLDLLMVAQSTTVTGLSTFAPAAWAYQVCPRPASGNVCPAGTATPYGGVRLSLMPGDTLKIRLVNNLPKVSNTLDRVVDDPLLQLNPTNLHTHGLVVDATANTSVPPAAPLYGDFIFTSVFNPANGDPATIDPTTYNILHSHGDVVKNGVVDYNIAIPSTHPEGNFWFHPHMHGIAVNQISAGLAGIISVGGLDRYACRAGVCSQPLNPSLVRHLVLKEMQVQSGTTAGAPQYQTDSAFCPAAAATGEAPRNGVCAADTTLYPAGSKWFFTINGQQYPTIAQATADGEIWRIQNASASMSYGLALVENSTKRNMIMQLLSLDGITVSVPPGTKPGQTVTVSSGSFTYVACPIATTGAPATITKPLWIFDTTSYQPVCVTDLKMMPSSRAEVWATWRDASSNIATAPIGASATLVTRTIDTGPVGDAWPTVNLANVTFAAGTRNSSPDSVRSYGYAALNTTTSALFFNPHPTAKPAALPANCAALPVGARRRIYFANMGTDATGNPIFGLGYETIDANGASVPGSLRAVSRFDPLKEICIPLADGNKPVAETWELVNLSGELHNFHLHQTKFRIVSGTAPAGSVYAANTSNGGGIDTDNAPLPWASAAAGYTMPDAGACTIDDYKAGRCTASIVTVLIPFVKVGRFVFHCHILEHEDGGMMNSFRVVPSAK